MTVVWAKEFTVPPDDRDGICGVKVEDGGQAMIMYDPLGSMYQRDGETLYDPSFFIRLHSWDEEPPFKHTLFRSLMGRRVRVTIETIDDDAESAAPEGSDSESGLDADYDKTGGPF